MSVLALIVHIAYGTGCCVWSRSSGYCGCASWYSRSSWCGASSSRCRSCSSTWYSEATDCSSGGSSEEAEPVEVNHFVTGNTLTETVFTHNSATHHFWASNWDSTQCANYINCDTNRFTIRSRTDATTHTILCSNFGYSFSSGS